MLRIPSLLACAAVSAAFAVQARSLEFANEIERPLEPAGLSSLAWAGGEKWWAADDSGGLVYPLALAVDAATGALKSCATGTPIRLEGAKDVEGLAWDAANALFWATDEDDASLRAFDAATGRRRAAAPVPAAQRAFRDNLSLEALSLSPDGLTLWTCNEEALAKNEGSPRMAKDAPAIADGPRADARKGTRVRLVRFSRAAANAPWTVSGQWCYETDAVGGEAVPLVGRAQCGVSGLCALADGTLLALEREMSVKKGAFLPSFRCRVYAVDCAKATDVSNLASVCGDAVRPVAKERLFDRDTGLAMYEGIAAGPQLADGATSVVLVSDADFGAVPRLMALKYRAAAAPAVPVPDPPADLFPLAAYRPAATNLAAFAAAFPDADYVVLDDRVHTRYEPDGRDVTLEDEWLLILTEKGRRAQASETLAFNARYGDADFLAVEILGTNGVLRKVDFAATRKTATDNSSMGMNIYDPQDKKTTIAVPGLAVGEVRRVVTRRRTLKPRMKDAWVDLNLLETVAPIVRASVSVDQPAARPVVKAVLRHPFENTVTREKDRPLPGGRTLLSWTARDVPQVFPEPNMPPFLTQVQALRLSTVADWPAVSRWYWGLCERHLAPSAEMRAEVAARVKDAPDRAAKIRALFRFVSQDVRYMGLTLEDDAPGYEPHDVALTFARRYGVCRDKAALLVSLLREAGVSAYPCLIHAGARMDAEVPMPYFNHAIVAVDDGKGGWQLMDPTDESTRDLFPSYLSNRSYLVARPEGDGLRTTPVVSVDANLLRVVSDATLSPDGSLLLSSTLSFGGINDNFFRSHLRKRTPRDRRKTFEALLRGVSPGADLLALEILPADLADVATPLVAKLTARLPDALVRGKTRDDLAVPFVTAALNVARSLLDENTALEKRRFPLELPTTAGADESVRLVLGDAVAAPLPLPADLAAGAGAFRCTRTYAVTNGVLTARRRFVVSGVDFEPDAYETLREDLKDVESAERDTPRFAARENEDAHVAVLLNRSVVHLVSPHAWTETNVVEKEILTYKGKKDNAELKFSWQGAVESFQLVSASVSNRTGEVRALAPEEINVMDAGWAAAAPRYPAGKILVANLSAVDVGSVVRWTAVRTVTNAPLAWMAFKTFDSAAPVRRVEFELHAPAAVPVQFSDFPAQPPCRAETAADGARTWTWRVDDPPRLPDEPAQPSASLWRKALFATAADWRAHGRALAAALAAARQAGSETARAAGAALAEDAATPEEIVRRVRAFLVHRVRVAGPGLFELPFDRAFTPPDCVLAEGYGSAADRMNLFFALLEGAGFDCSFLFGAGDAHLDSAVTRLYERLPRPSFFDEPVVRARWRTAWLPFFGETRTLHLAGENEYAPPEAPSTAGDRFYDPAAETFGVVPCAEEGRPRTESVCRIDVRADGSAEFEITNFVWGAAVGAFRKRWTEMRPEWRSRTHRQMLGELAQNALATSDLATDVESYPASISFRCCVPEFATFRDGVVSLRAPNLDAAPFGGISRQTRKTPYALNAKDLDRDVVEIVFPRGYTAVERLPEPFVFSNPSGGTEEWVRQDVETHVADDRLHVRVTRTAQRLSAAVLPPAHAALLAEWNRRAASLPACTFSARKNERKE